MRKTAKTSDKVRRDICARSFWASGQKALFDVRVFDPNARRYSKQTLKQFHERKWKETSRQHQNNGSGSR